MPIWIVILQALLTPTIALGVGVIAFLQWRTAHHKVLLDLFERRMDVYDQANSLYREVVRNGIRVDMATVAQFHAVRNRARFLFDSDVNGYLKQWHEHFIDMGISAQMMQENSPEYQSHVAKAHAALKEIIKFPGRFPLLCEPYMRMTQKRVRAPAEWFRDRNSLRKSFDDQGSE